MKIKHALHQYLYIQGTDEDAWTDYEVVVHFMAKDEESTIEYCEWAVGASQCLDSFDIL